MMKFIKTEFKNWKWYDYAWLLIANTIILSLGLYWGDSPIALISAVTGVTCVIFISKQMILNYAVGAINVALYAYLAYKSRLYGDFMINAFYYFPCQFIGMYMWSRASKKSGEVKSKRLTNKQRIVIALVSIVAIIGYSFVLRMLGGNLTLIDSTSTVLSFIAMLLMLNQYLEQWYIWVVVNGVSVLMWFLSIKGGSGDASTLIMWILYLLNSIYGLINWIKNNKKN